MTSYQQLAELTYRFGKDGYLELARKKVTEKDESTEFIVLSRGYVDERGTKRWTKFVTLPASAEARTWLAEAIAAV